MRIVHRPVLVQAVVEALELRAGGVVLDATLGLGGHAEAFLEATAPSGRLVGIDRDEQALDLARQRLERFQDRLILAHSSFGRLAQVLKEKGVGALDAAFFDLGVSSLQLDEPQRGFSFAREGPLDMRMDKTEQTTAADIVNRANPKDLEQMIRDYGEERFAGRIARAIVRKRPFATTTQLAQWIRAHVPGARQKIDPATRTFQAIRIAVNQELDVLPVGLAQAVDHLKPGGRIAVLAYHSLEDGIVKRFLKQQAQDEKLEIVTRKPIRTSESEIEQNPRSRSARLRVGKRL